MKTRLGIFVAVLLVFPLLGLWLSQRGWADLQFNQLAARVDSGYAGLICALCLIIYIVVLNLILRLRRGQGILGLQSRYFATIAVCSALLGWLLFYLNYFTGNWAAPQLQGGLDVLSVTLLFATLVPAVLMTRALLGAFPALLRRLSFSFSMPAPESQMLIFVLLPVALFGLMAGAAWPSVFFWLFWLAPLLLMVLLQVMWSESTVFSAIRHGDLGRVFCSVLAGLIVGNLFILGYEAAGGEFLLMLPGEAWMQAGFAVFGLLSMQLGDILAERWRGTNRTAMLVRHRPFPVSVVTKD